FSLPILRGRLRSVQTGMSQYTWKPIGFPPGKTGKWLLAASSRIGNSSRKTRKNREIGRLTRNRGNWQRFVSSPAWNDQNANRPFNSRLFTAPVCFPVTTSRRVTLLRSLEIPARKLGGPIHRSARPQPTVGEKFWPQGLPVGQPQVESLALCFAQVR